MKTFEYSSFQTIFLPFQNRPYLTILNRFIGDLCMLTGDAPPPKKKTLWAEWSILRLSLYTISGGGGGKCYDFSPS